MTGNKSTGGGTVKHVKEGHTRPVVCLDAGHYGRYNQSPVVPEYYESEMNRKLQQFLKEKLEGYGIQVRLIRQDPEADLNEYLRGTVSAGADLLLSIHSNAAERESADHPVVYVPLDGSGTELGKLLGACIRDVMDTDEPERVETRAGANGDYYGVIRGAAAVGTTALILEHSFHTNPRAARWLLSEENLTRMAQAEAKVLAQWFGLEKENTVADWYRIRKNWQDAKSQTAAYRSLEGAIAACPVGYSVFDGQGNAVYTNYPGHATAKEYSLKLPPVGMGATSSLVKAVQLLLIGRGFDCGSAGADGIFGEQTKAAVIAWQKNCGLPQSGVVDSMTMTCLLGI